MAKVILKGAMLTAKAIIDGLADLVFPRNCQQCGECVDEDSPYNYLCSRCSRDLYIVQPPHCHTCGFPFFGLVSGEQECPHCTELKPQFEEGKTLFLARGAGRELIHALKYNQGFHILKDLEVIISQIKSLHSYLQDTVLVPVPLHPRKAREREFNQCELIADMIAGLFPVAGSENLLERIADTRSQTTLPRKERLLNVRHAFRVKNKAEVDRSKTYVMIDDVFTTGATFNACCRALRSAGAQKIKVLSLGHG